MAPLFLFRLKIPEGYRRLPTLVFDYEALPVAPLSDRVAPHRPDALTGSGSPSTRPRPCNVNNGFLVGLGPVCSTSGISTTFIGNSR